MYHAPCVAMIAADENAWKPPENSEAAIDLNIVS